ncbi:hypothetical protein [Capnocytophaga catalasegens]|uniref:Late embryogenesis abundant protein LEA-2 subgroup domain-containing protein n=1 Tax=Capnocytophaga catalasegens TaxID=1004260 RepID=A0AAV5AZ24_9FLAO|nr:hypothetical protein [Capnocytophaga catalasegens]GIZ16627.1 hypothetical protein RCZ03_26270 [Capnocytophaga catalasegens]GJM51271.1 hypothetical protein RCZ15_22440 [Capnocytophaga catalasegens]GJM54002.1 hypothetical protein RCZ16_23180 [Capnocytophaga catalasegens]
MKIERKHIILGLVAVLGGSMMNFVSGKVNQAKAVFEKIEIKLSTIKRIRIANSALKFDVDISLQNPTSQDFTASSGGLLKGRLYRVYLKEKLLIMGSLNDIEGINLPVGGTHTFKDISVSIPLIDVGKELLSIVGGGDIFSGLTALTQKGLLDKVKSIEFQNLLKDLRYEIDIEGFGQIYTFKEKL